MSAHSCNDLCKIDDEFHIIQKYGSDDESWWMSKEDMRNHLLKEIQNLFTLLNKL